MSYKVYEVNPEKGDVFRGAFSNKDTAESVASGGSARTGLRYEVHKVEVVAAYCSVHGKVS